MKSNGLNGTTNGKEGWMNRNEKVEFLLKLNGTHSALFCSPDARLARDRYRAKHPTEIGAFKCMDGRIHIPIATNTPLGIIQPYRNLGGKFNLGWPYFAKDVSGWVEYSVDHGRDVLILVTYHYSRGDKHRGCAGHEYDTDQAIRETATLKKQVENVFGINHKVVYPILFGFETDFDAGILHGENGEVLDLSTINDVSEKFLVSTLQRLYPDMPDRILRDLLPLVVGNISHIAEVKASNRPLTEVVHKEWVIGVGRGFDWLHEPNMALLIGPFSPKLNEPVETAAHVIKSNMDGNRIGSDSFVLLTSAIYRDPVGHEPLLAREKALFLRDFCVKTISEKFPELADKICPLPVTVDMGTREMKVVSD